MIKFDVPDDALSVFGDTESVSKNDEVDPNATAVEIEAAGISKFDLEGMEVDLVGGTTSLDVSETDFLNHQGKLDVDEILANPELNGINLDVIARTATDGRGIGGEESVLTAAQEIMAAQGGGAGSKLQAIAREADSAWAARYGADPSKTANVSSLANTQGRDALEETPIPEELGVVGAEHDTDGINSDFRATLGGMVYGYMLDNGFDPQQLNQALSAGGTMESLDDMRNATAGLHSMAAGSAIFAGLSRFLEEFDMTLADRQAQANPDSEVKPALGTTPEVDPATPKPEEMAFNPQDPEYANNQMGMTPGGPRGMA